MHRRLCGREMRREISVAGGSGSGSGSRGWIRFLDGRDKGRERKGRGLELGVWVRYTWMQVPYLAGRQAMRGEVEEGISHVTYRCEVAHKSSRSRCPYNLVPRVVQTRSTTRISLLRTPSMHPTLPLPIDPSSNHYMVQFFPHASSARRARSAPLRNALPNLQLRHK